LFCSEGRARWFGPETSFGFAASSQAGVDFTRSQIPAEQLLSGSIVATAIQSLQERRRGQAACAQVEAEVNESIELTLVQRDFNEAKNGSFCLARVSGEYSDRLGFSDVAGEGLVRQQPVAISNRRKARHVGIDPAAKPLRFLNQF
jgi:hypothetical protein